MERTDNGYEICAIGGTIRLISGKYKAVILYHLLEGCLRYSQIHRHVPYASDKTLAQQLRELERDGLITRTVHPSVPPKTEYALTQLGSSLEPILHQMKQWGDKHYICRSHDDG